MEEKKKRGRGRPAKFNSPDELREMADKYFNDLNVYDTDGIYSHTRPALVTGLARALGFCDRQSLYDYEKRAEYSCTIKAARMRVEESYENALFSRSCTGAIFGLKNMGWKDKQDIEHFGKVEGGAAVYVTRAEITKEEKDDIGFMES